MLEIVLVDSNAKRYNNKYRWEVEQISQIAEKRDGLVHRPQKEKDLGETVRAAPPQIEEKQYAKALEAKGFQPGRIRKYGFAFEGKNVLIG